MAATPDATHTSADERERELVAEAVADARATRLLIRFGIGALVLLLAWIPIVFLGFRG